MDLHAGESHCRVRGSRRRPTVEALKLYSFGVTVEELLSIPEI